MANCPPSSKTCAQIFASLSSMQVSEQVLLSPGFIFDCPDFDVPCPAVSLAVIENYRNDCIGGFVYRYVQPITVTCSGITAIGSWTFDSLQGCCSCTASSSSGNTSTS